MGFIYFQQLQPYPLAHLYRVQSLSPYFNTRLLQTSLRTEIQPGLSKLYISSPF